MVSGTERKLMKMFRALAMNEEDAVIPARRYRSKPRLALAWVRSAFSFLRLRLLLSKANDLDMAKSEKLKPDTKPSAFVRWERSSQTRPSDVTTCGRCRCPEFDFTCLSP